MQIGKRFSFRPSSSNNTRAEPLVAQSSYSRSIFTTRGFSVTDGEDKKQQLKKKLTANHLPCSYAWPLAVATYLLMACLVYPNLRREKVCSFTFVGYTLIFIRGKPRGGTNVCLWIIDGGCMWFWTLFFVPVDRLFTQSWFNRVPCCCSKIVIKNRFMWFCTVSKCFKLNYVLLLIVSIFCFFSAWRNWYWRKMNFKNCPTACRNWRIWKRWMWRTISWTACPPSWWTVATCDPLGYL